jgi:hypothetical protein
MEETPKQPDQDSSEREAKAAAVEERSWNLGCGLALVIVGAGGLAQKMGWTLKGTGFGRRGFWATSTKRFASSNTEGFCQATRGHGGCVLSVRSVQTTGGVLPSSEVFLDKLA